MWVRHASRARARTQTIATSGAARSADPGRHWNRAARLAPVRGDERGGDIADARRVRLGRSDCRRPQLWDRLLIPDRVRRPPREGFSWIDRRFLNEYAARLTGDAVFLYLFLAAVSDQHGLSFYRDATIAVRLRMREPAVVAARDELLTHGLIAYESPLTQLLALPAPRLERRGQHALRTLFESLPPSGGAS